jgi:hypothetical protein
MRTAVFRTLVLLVLAGVNLAIPKAANYSCPGSITDSCVNSSSCTGDAYRRTGTCSIQCMNATSHQDQYVDGAACSCGPERPNGGGGNGDGGICQVYPDACIQMQ